MVGYGRRIRPRNAFGLAAVAAVAAATLWLAPAAGAKSFTIAAVQVEATLRPDGAMAVVEHITYDFDGSFSNGFRPIPPGDYQLVEMSVSEAGRPVPFDGAPYALHWTYAATDERRTFDIAYVVLGAAKVGPDVAELYWKFVGTDHPGVGVVRAALTVPGDGLDVRAWAHGPLNGLVEPRGSTVLFSVDDVAPGQFVEGRVAVPTANFSVAPIGDARLPVILSEEQRLADEANAMRARDAAAAERRTRIANALGRGYFVVPVLSWIVFFVLWRRYGREHDPPPDVGEYVREPLDDPPALVPTLFNWGGVEPIALSATIVDLAQRGYLTITETVQDRLLLPDKADWKFTWKENDAPVRSFEHAVLERLFEHGRETTQSEFAAWCKHHRSEADRWWQDVKRRITSEFDQRHYIEGSKGLPMAANVVAALITEALGLVALVLGQPIGLLGVVGAPVQLVAGTLLRRRSAAGRRRFAEWKAFERHLRDFSQMEDAPVGHLILWERYLVYAVALGVTAQVARALAARIPQPTGGADTVAFAPWFSGRHGPGALDSIGSLADFSGSFGPTIVAAAQPPSSSSSGGGGGGGFSGGGGGGGGGGGIGAS